MCLIKSMLLLEQIDEYKAAIGAYRPLKPEEVKELDSYYRIGTTYSSNALEGNTLTLTETKVIIEDGITVGGKSLRDCNEAVGHAKAFDYMLEVARGGALKITEALILQLHRLFYSGIDADAAGCYRDHQVFITGTTYLPPAPEAVPALMHAFATELAKMQANKHPVVLAAYAHRRLADIHPFVDGNGRTARLLMNLILVNRGYCVVSIPPVLRVAYIDALHAAQREQNPSDEHFVALICECELEAQRDYFRMFRIPLPQKGKEQGR